MYIRPSLLDYSGYDKSIRNLIKKQLIFIPKSRYLNILSRIKI
ncbi:hypothetical protein TPHV1_110028 [Treponema phagedenis]|uniref:Uncharacterized protein n=1 Tax=Treponema phagedenis TaxID=162 RepID=A0A0B7GTE6_TREPH|nr:hypothetical protein TPHV1_110028 [Treponema phagedenis]